MPEFFFIFGRETFSGKIFENFSGKFSARKIFKTTFTAAFLFNEPS
jgi:hypothetical protein